MTKMNELPSSAKIKYLQEWNANLRSQLDRERNRVERAIMLAARQACPPGMAEKNKNLSVSMCEYYNCEDCVAEWLRLSDEHIC